MRTYVLALADGTHADYWYDRHTRCWIVQHKDSQHNQIGDAFYCYTKEEACVHVGYLSWKILKNP